MSTARNWTNSPVLTVLRSTNQQIGFQSIALTQSEPRVTADSTPNTNPPPTPGLDRQNEERATSTASKASKPEDDFDVDEYFARLQGTRYVSAPINSTVNPQPAEENLEEINLNEPEKSPAESSITADIAQNFSQLPTVLPQVASAVFSSFSNMLYKSREQTPDEKPVSNEVLGGNQVIRPEDVGVPLMGMDEPVQRDVAPPPRELPVAVGGTTNFRITTKKKTYAQIPGLSSQAPGVGSQMPGLNPEQAPGFNPMAGHSVPIPDYPFDPRQRAREGQPPQNPGVQSYQEPPRNTPDTYQIPPTHPPKPGYYPPRVESHTHVPGVSPTKLSYSYSQIPGLGYAEMPIDMPLHNLESTAQTMFHEYVNDPRRRSVETQETSSTQTQDSNQGQNIQQPSQQEQFKIFNPLETNSAQNPSQDLIAHSSAMLNFDNQQSRIGTQGDINIPSSIDSQGVPPPTLNASQDNISYPPQMHQRDHHHRTVDYEKDIKIFNPLQSHDNTPSQMTSQPTDTSKTTATDPSKPIDIQKEIKMFNPLEIQAQTKEPTAAKDNQANLFTTVEQTAQQTFSQEPASAPSTSIIPPPPMFSNVPRKDGQPTVGKSVLPPSVARRIGANHPIIKPQTMQPPTIPSGNIFIPAPIDDNKGSSPGASDHQNTDAPSTVSIPSAFVQFHASSPSVVDSKSGFRDGGITGLSIPYKQPPMRYAHDYSHDSPPAWFPPGPSNQQQTVYPPVTEAANVPSGLFQPNPIDSFSQPPPYSGHQAQQITGQYSGQIATPEAPKPVAEPPKVTGNLNYRMTKKRPQYYSGPIEGVGAISNNVKPVIPVAEPSAFQGALFTPNQQQSVEQVPNLESAPFDISQPTNATPYAQFDITQTQASGQPEYSTAFDLSRPTTETYEPKYEPPQESKGFGIIGSLKSKLVSLDINKIHNTVTTFFDPAYNDTKKEPGTDQSYAPYSSNQGNTSSFGQQDSSLEIFVPNNELSQTYTQGYNSQLNYPTYNYSQSNQYYQNQAYNQNQGYQEQGYTSQMFGGYMPDSVPQNPATYSNVYGQVPETQTGLNLTTPVNPSEEEVLQNVQQPVDDKTVETTAEKPEIPKEEIPKEETPKESSSAFTESTGNTYNLFLNNNEAISTPVSIFAQINVDTNKNNKPQNSIAGNFEPKPSLNFFDNQQFHVQPEKTEDISNQLKNLQISQEGQVDEADTKPKVLSVPSNNNIQSELTRSIDFFENITAAADQSPFGVEMNKNNAVGSEKNMGNNLLQIQETQDTVPAVNVSTVPLFDLSSILAEKAKEITDLQDSVKNIILEDRTVDRKKFDSSSSADFFENIGTVPQPLTDEENEGVSELSICETCREVSKPEDNEVDDLTKQLIENITSPIQLSNPVIAPLTEDNTPVNAPIDFASQQCAEISHITEETIETIQVQSATELLDEIVEAAKPDVTNFGWTTESNAYIPPEVLLDHDYSFAMDPATLGFYGNNAMFFENIPNNASDELKAEFKSSQEDMPVPTAPPAEDDDTKSDETGGLDVHLIEQDAKKDFPIYEEFVIEPSETDDDKIEYKERERSSEDPVPEVDSFTNRVERFKKMEETTVENDEELTEEQKNMLFDIASASQNIASPAITIASYFDTGNFAVESHYRNSLSSPSAMHFQMGSPEIPMRIPPGFENEFKRRLSGLIAQDNTMHDTNKDIDQNIIHIPETSTQTRPVITTTYSTVSNVGKTMVTTISKIEPLVAEKKPQPEEMKLPAFASVFGRQDSGDAASSFISKVEEKKEASATFFAPEAEKIEAQKLADPISFFTSAQETTSTDNNFNRLASYFSTPPKTDPEKSFFELSQSQNHYRHSTSLANNNIAQNLKPNNNLDPNNIPNIYMANLMKDLTSPQNIVTSNDQVIRTVNYFTVEYANDEMKTLKLGEFKKDEHLDKANISYPVELKEDEHLDDDKILTVVTKCKHCNNIDSRRVVTLNKVELDKVDFKFRKAMDSGSSEGSKTSTNTMEARRDDRRRDVTVTFENPHEDSEGVAIMAENRSNAEYSPVKHHWFYRVDVEGKSIWRGFSTTDSRALEDAFHSPDLNENTVVPTDGGRFDVNVMGRLRIAVYWPDKPTNVRRCSWFYKGATLYVPYTEPVAEKLEEEYRHGVTTGEWHRRLVLPNNESVVMHGPQVMVHFPQSASDTFGSAPESTMRPRVVRRGCDETEIEDPEPSSIDHLLLLCHGVGSACDMRFRSVEEVVDDFRATSLQLVQSHYRNAYDKGVVNRVEALPISWHSTLHSGETGVDKRLAAITLESIPRLRSFTNDTVLDVLLYTSPVFCQTIIDTVCAELNRIYKLFKKRNPLFKGEVSLGGHSLGSVILYDLLCHQQGGSTVPGSPNKSYLSGPAGTGQPSVNYPSLGFTPAALFAFGSPIAMFECIRGVKSLGADFSLPTCKNFFNIFHPYDPIAYRIEPLINSQLGDVKPYLIPHHKGRKRMHLELKDTMARVGADLKQKLLESLKATWTSMWKSQPPPNDGQLEKVVEEEMEKETLCEEIKEEAAQNDDMVATPEMLGHLNAGRRVDYVLQEAPFEMINEYLFAMSSHVCYWESEDTMLLILREIYDSLGVQPDCTVPQQTMTVHRTRQAQDDAIIVGTPENPSTSRGGT
ncbi:hypothetical protein ABMA27_012318 [Loxostege sticticalis]|uniref:Uncharacterized protein n=1 Tax=Loxostege sticticalis TaxID=481309 RepID=A0ABR3H0W4_LOXSC